MIARSMLRAAFAALTLAAMPAAARTAPAGGDIRIDDRDVYPESLDADRAGRLYVGSIKGIVFRTTPRSNVAGAWIRPTPENGLLSILGVLVDERGGALWLCSAPMGLRVPPSTGTSALKKFDLRTGALQASYPLPAPASACNDIAIARDRTIYLTDTPNARILMLRPDADVLSLYAHDPALHGVDGIAFAEDGSLYVNSVSDGTMLRVERQADGAFAGLTKLATSRPLAGPDGLRPIGGNRFLQAEGNSGTIALVTIEGDRANVTDLATGLVSSPGIAPARGRAFAAEGKITYLFDPKLKGQDPGPFLLRAIALPPSAR